MSHGFELYFLFAIRELRRIGGARGLDKISPKSGNGLFLPVFDRCPRSPRSRKPRDVGAPDGIDLSRLLLTVLEFRL